MKCENNFKKFDENISLDDTRLKKINDARSAFETFISNDSKENTDEIGTTDLFLEAFLQGSCATKTCTKPATDEEEFDVDIVLSLNLKKLTDGLNKPDSSPKKVVEWLEKRLKTNDNYKDKIKELKQRCVRISYKGDFHVDIVPVTPIDGKDGILWIPDKLEGWDKTNPKGFISWCNDREKISGGYFKHIVKYLKWWRSAIAPDKANVNSILLATLIGNHIMNGNSYAETLVNTMESLNLWLQGCLSTPEINNPSLDTENLARDWSQSDFDLFKKYFDLATKNSRAALNETDLTKSIELWRTVFGDNFPISADADNGNGDKSYVLPSTATSQIKGPIIIKNPSKPHYGI
ncbi:MAG: hypothetical protein PHX21_11820 [bacterium]|nr:hypothetical protein [bacterium]